ncbi:peptidoglycan DD-metalloendopeptidase family protein [Thiofaba sp. EF100]|uniref:peptidoglycan DD-metalloendopeptidase family protein n=1 Tax=Thiofaba sp. EF100 TaxID=3121274 RepID=UPI00322221BD
MSPSARLLVVGLLLVLTGCSGPAVRFVPEDGVHVVKRGETLYSIATAYDMDWRELASRNGLRPPYTLHVGQRLVLAENRVTQEGAASDPGPQASGKMRKASPPLPPIGRIPWVWPTEGRVVTTFVQGHATRKGIDIAGELGQPVRAAASGEVVYSGSGLAGYGKLIILKHDERFLSAYAYNQALLVSEGETVQSGQIIARMGQAEAGKPMLHFEIRLDGNPIDPLRQLPQASR